MNGTRKSIGKRYTRREVKDLIVAKAMKDEAFRTGLLADPKSMVERQISGLLPESFRVEIIHEDSDTLYVVLPPNFPEDPELEEEHEFLDCEIHQPTGR